MNDEQFIDEQLFISQLFKQLTDEQSEQLFIIVYQSAVIVHRRIIIHELSVSSFMLPRF